MSSDTSHRGHRRGELLAVADPVVGDEGGEQVHARPAALLQGVAEAAGACGTSPAARRPSRTWSRRLWVTCSRTGPDHVREDVGDRGHRCLDPGRRPRAEDASSLAVTDGRERGGAVLQLLRRPTADEGHVEGPFVEAPGALDVELADRVGQRQPGAAEVRRELEPPGVLGAGHAGSQARRAREGAVGAVAARQGAGRGAPLVVGEPVEHGGAEVRRRARLRLGVHQRGVRLLHEVAPQPDERVDRREVVGARRPRRGPSPPGVSSSRSATGMSGAARSETTTATIEIYQSVACTGWGPSVVSRPQAWKRSRFSVATQPQEQQGGADEDRQRDRARSGCSPGC